MTARHQLLRRRRRPCRAATAVVELAVCLPVLMTLVVGTIEVCTMLHVGQSLKVSAYEGARVGTISGSDSENVRFHCETLLNSMGVQDAVISMSPPSPGDLETGDYFEVTTSASYGHNSLFNGWMFADKVIERTVSLRFE